MTYNDGLSSGSFGYIFDGSGGPEIFRKAKILALGSVNSYIFGKHFN